MRPQPLDEGALDLGVARGPLRAGCRVERDRVDVHPAAAAAVELGAEQVGPPAVVVDVADQGVLDADPAAGHLEVAVRGVEDLGDLPPGVDGDQILSKIISAATTLFDFGYSLVLRQDR